MAMLANGSAASRGRFGMRVASTSDVFHGGGENCGTRSPTRCKILGSRGAAAVPGAPGAPLVPSTVVVVGKVEVIERSGDNLRVGLDEAVAQD